jgi:osmotically-inducible protein OsmY
LSAGDSKQYDSECASREQPFTALPNGFKFTDPRSIAMAYGNFWRHRERERAGYGALGWNPEGEWFDDKPRGYSGEGYLGTRYRGSPRGIDYERNWGNEARNDYGERDYYGRREYGDYSRRGAQGSEIDYEMNDYRSGMRDISSDTEESVGYRGRGPRNYKRSDERIREDVCQALTIDARVDASDVEVTVENGEVTLSGTVQSRPQKRRAEDIAESVSGVIYVHDTLRVASESGRAEAEKGTTSSPMTTTAETMRY